MAAMEIATGSRTNTAPTKVRSRTERARYNGRSREGRAVSRLADELKAALGAPVDRVTLRAVQRAAELSFIASELRARRLRGEAVDVEEIVKAENAADRAVRRLGIKQRAEPYVPLRERWAAEAVPDDEEPTGEALKAAIAPSEDDAAEAS